MSEPAAGIPVYTVGDLLAGLGALLEERVGRVWVVGEVSNLRRAGSGHLYFTLKDRQAALRCVMWRNSVARQTQLPQNGDAIEVHGSISIYEASGNYQLYADLIRPAGEGVLYQEFLRLKEQLQAEGLFEPHRKRSIPTWPVTIGIVTSIAKFLRMEGFFQMFGFEGIPVWMGDPRTVRFAIAAVVVWQAAGFYMVLFLAAMENIPETYYEAARLDGATCAQQFWRITLPLMWDVLTIGVVFGAFALALYGFTLLPPGFFPYSTRPQFMVDLEVADVFRPTTASTFSPSARRPIESVRSKRRGVPASWLPLDQLEKSGSPPPNVAEATRVPFR